MLLLSSFIALCLTVSEILTLQLCGRELADRLDVVCFGRGFHWAETTASAPQISRSDAVQYLEPTFSHTARGIVNECCRKACSFQEIESYCAARPGQTRAYTLSEVANEMNSRLQTDPPRSTTETTRPPTTRSTTRQARPGQRLFGTFGRQSSIRFFFVVQKLGPGITRSPSVSNL